MKYFKILFIAIFLITLTTFNVQANPASQALLDAIYKNNFSLMKEALDKGADVNYHKQGQFTPLTLAVKNKNIALVSYLIDKGADVNKPVANAALIQTPLIMAINNNDLEIVKLLIENGANPNITQKSRQTIFDNKPINQEETTPLILAIKKDYVDEPPSIEMIEYLIAKGANVNQTDSQGYTPLMATLDYRWANQHQIRYEIAVILLNAGAEPNITDFNNKTALQYAYENNFLSMVRLLSKLAPK